MTPLGINGKISFFLDTSGQIMAFDGMKPADMLRQTRPRDELRLCGWVLTGFPLLWAAVPALLLAAPLLFGVALVRMNSRIERTRFLWSMAIAIDSATV